jgi:hypothetical protein
MVYRGVSPPYSSLDHPVEGDGLGKGSQNYDVSGSYIRKGKDIGRNGTGVVTISQLDYGIEGHGKD